MGKFRRLGTQVTRRAFERHALALWPALYPSAIAIIRQRTEAEDPMPDARLNAFAVYSGLVPDVRLTEVLHMVNKIAYKGIAERNRRIQGARSSLRKD